MDKLEQFPYSKGKGEERNCRPRKLELAKAKGMEEMGAPNYPRNALKRKGKEHFQLGFGQFFKSH